MSHREESEWEKALRDLQRAVRAYLLGLGNELEGAKRIIDAERQARDLIEKRDLETTS